MQIQLYRDGRPSRRAQIAADLSDAVRETTVAGIRCRNPGYGDAEVKAEFQIIKQ